MTGRWVPTNDPDYSEADKVLRMMPLVHPTLDTILALPNGTEMSTVEFSPMHELKIQSVIIDSCREQMEGWRQARGGDARPFTIVFYILPDNVIPDSPDDADLAPKGN